MQYHDKRLMVMFFDFSSMGIPEQLRAQEAALKFIDTEMSTADMVAIMLYSTVLQVKTDFTADRTQLKDIINSLPIGELSELADAADTATDDEEDTGAAFVADETEFNIYNTDRKLAAIEDASKKLSALPEKKALIYFAGGVARTGVDNQAQLEASINAAAKANVAIYPIDARGLMADPPGGGASKAASRGTGIFTGSVYNSQRAAINNSQETLATLASDTGGKAFLDSNELSLGIVQAQQEYRSYYVLGYYSTNLAMDGKYRKITVKLNNNQSAKLEFRQGYYADKVWGKFNGQDKEQKLQEAMNAGDPVTDIPLAVEADYFRITPTAYFVPVSVKVPGSVIDLAQEARRRRDRVRLSGPDPGRPQSGRGHRAGLHQGQARSGRGRQTQPPELPLRRRLYAVAGQVPDEVPGAGKPERQDGHVRHALRGARPGGRLGGAENQLGDLEQPEGAVQGRGGRGGEREGGQENGAAEPAGGGR